MVAAGATLWLMFALWIAAPHVGASRRVQRTAGALVIAELALLLVWSYGTERCDGSDCAPFARAVGAVARVDVPIFAAIFLGVTVVLGVRRAPSG